MAVNNLTIEQAYTLINALQAEVTGANPSTVAIDNATFNTVAQTTLKCGYDAVLNGIMQMVRKTIVSVRPYSAKFSGIEMTADRWGAIVRKINFIDQEALEDPTFNRTGDVTGYNADTDQYNAPEAAVVETHYYGANVYMQGYKIYKEQLVQAFTGPEAFAEFMSGLLTHYSNQFEQWFEDVKRSTLNNFILAKAEAGKVVYLLDEYKDATGLTNLTPTSVLQPANYGPFMKWSYARINQIAELFTERTELFQSQITGKKIKRHTPKADQRLFMSAKYLGSLNAEVLADTYNDSFLKYATTEAVNFWQNPNKPEEINGTFTTIDATGAAVAKTAANLTGVIGALFDRDAVGVNIEQNELEATQYNAKTQFSVVWHHARVRLESDQTEKGVVFMLTAGN